MKKIITGLLFTSLAFLIVSCKSGKTYEIKMKLAQGDHFEQNMQMDMRMNYAVSGQSVNMRMGMDMASFFDVLKSGADEKQIKMTYSRAKMTMDMGKLNALANTDSILNKANSRLVGKSVTVVLSKNNEIKDVINADMLTGDDSDPESKEMMKKMFTKEQINSLFGMMFSLYPDKPVAIGDSWEKENKINMGEFEMKVKTKYTLTGINNGIAAINVDGTVTGKGNMVNKVVDMDMTGTQKGTMDVTLATGYLKDGNYTMAIKVDMNAGGQKIPMTMDADYKMSGK